ncbi:MAG: autotransporter outer membrane beta-barrel domain-containing protein [Gammaproteobacteria bacterium]|nr:autotransporter outer membrane beta-barrel domain-containing protein [Gammaproteobacteria bacterium]
MRSLISTLSALLIAATATLAGAAPATFTFSQGGFSEGAAINGSFSGEDLDGNGELSQGELTAFAVTFSGNSIVPGFSLGLPDLFGLVYRLDGGPLGDDLTGGIEGIGATGSNFGYEVGPGPQSECGIGIDCAVVSDFTMSGADDFSQLLVAINGGFLTPGGFSELSTITTETAGSNVAPAAVIVQTAAEAATIIAQRFATFASRAMGMSAPAPSAVFNTGGAVPLAAGDFLDTPMGYWASYSRNNLNNDFSATAFDGSVTNVLGGVDWSFGDNLLVGLAAGYERQDFVTIFNGGGQETDGIVVAPYAGYRLSDQWSVDGTVGFTYSDIEQFRTQVVQTVSSELDAWRVFAAANLNWFGGRDRWLLSARGGLLYAQDSFDSFTENTGVAGGLFNPEREFDIGQASIGGEVGYAIGDFVPFVNGRFIYDVEESVVEVGPGQAAPGADRTEFQAGFGLRYFGRDNGISADVEFTTVETRENIDSYTISATVRIEL